MENKKENEERTLRETIDRNEKIQQAFYQGKSKSIARVDINVVDIYVNAISEKKTSVSNGSSRKSFGDMECSKHHSYTMNRSGNTCIDHKDFKKGSVHLIKDDADNVQCKWCNELKGKMNRVPINNSKKHLKSKAMQSVHAYMEEYAKLKETSRKKY